MRRRELDQTLRAAGRVAREKEFFLIGSQALHAQLSASSSRGVVVAEMRHLSQNHPETAGVLATKLGRGSEFAKRLEFYADIVTPEIASLPFGWQNRLKPLRSGGVAAHCLDLARSLIRTETYTRVVRSPR